MRFLFVLYQMNFLEYQQYNIIMLFTQAVNFNLASNKVLPNFITITQGN